MSVTNSTTIQHPQTKLSTSAQQFIDQSKWPNNVKTKFYKFIANQIDHQQKLSTLFDNPSLFEKIIPVITYNEYQDLFIIMYIDKLNPPSIIGETGSLLGYFRAYGYEDDILSSDCYGQLSCSACAIEILNGTPKNNQPREEENDMLCIDEERPATDFTRLSCQTLVGDTPLITMIRQPNIA